MRLNSKTGWFSGLIPHPGLAYVLSQGIIRPEQDLARSLSALICSEQVHFLDSLACICLVMLFHTIPIGTVGSSGWDHRFSGVS